MKQAALLELQPVGVKQLVVRKLGVDADATLLIEGERMVEVGKMVATVVEKVAPAPEAVPVDADKISEFPEVIGLAQIHICVNRRMRSLIRKKVGIAVVRKINAFSDRFKSAERSVRVIADAVDQGGSSLNQQRGIGGTLFFVMLNRIGLGNGIEELLIRLEVIRHFPIPGCGPRFWCRP